MRLALDATVGLEDPRFPLGNRLEALKRRSRGAPHSLRINAQWRICFTWTGKGSAEVAIVDDHRCLGITSLKAA